MTNHRARPIDAAAPMSHPPAPPVDSPAKLAPPLAVPRPFVVESPHGDRTDEYYWLRDDERSSADVLEHLERENAYTEAMLAPLTDQEDALFAELTGRLQPDETSVPVLHHGYWYTTRFTAGQEYPRFVRRRDAEDAPEEILLDVNAMASGHDYFQVGSYEVSPDGRLLAYTQDAVGRRQYHLFIKDLASGALLADSVPNVETDIAWTADSRRVLYIEKDPVTLLSVRVLAHALGADAADDVLVYEEADHSYYLSLQKSRSETYLLVCSQSTEQSEWRYAGAADPELRLQSVLPREPGHEYDVDHHGDAFVIRTNWQAPNFRIVRAPVTGSADKSRWADVIGHRTDVFIEDYQAGRDALAVNERAGGLLRVRLHDWQHGDQLAADRIIAGAEPSGSIALVATPQFDSPCVRYVYSSLSTPRTIYDYDIASGTSNWRKTEAVLGGFDSSRYATELRMAPARDGALIPVSLAYRKDTALDGTAPLYQYAYGSYGYSMDPDFRSSWVSLLDRGFVVAIAHVRGGQELGRAWYDDGRLLRKRNTFTDFIDATQMLVTSGYGAADKVCAQGGSAGGLLMGAIANMAPERYRVIVAHVPFVDVVTTMLDESIPLTTNEFDQWGDPRHKESYDYMLSYSPYDNVRAQDYPAMLVFTGLWDSQVQYFEPAKWVARLRARKTGEHPLLFSVDMSAGHGGKSGRFQRYRETAREYAFLLWQLGRLDPARAR
jgi:oligopeptidase B